MRIVSISTILWLSVTLCNCTHRQTETKESASEPTVPRQLVAQTFNSGFPMAHDSYNGISVGSDGKIYYVLCTQAYDVAGQVYAFDPETEEIKHLGDLTEACGEKGMNAIAQAKSHVNFIESNGKLYFATHVGYYQEKDGYWIIGSPPPGYKPYQGGHILTYDISSGTFESLGKEPHQEGILTMNMDTKRGLIYGLTWPTGYFFRFDVATQRWDDLGPVDGKGQAGKGPEWRTLSRTIVIDPDDGAAYVSIADGTILKCAPGMDAVEPVQGDNLKKDYFGYYEIDQPGHMAYNWRQVFWYPGDRKFYGVHGNSGYLFTFDPRESKIEVLDRLTSEPSQRSGMYDQFSFGYLGFILGPDGRTIYYLTGGPVYKDGQRVTGKSTTNIGEAKGLENVHLVTYDIPTKAYTDHGPIFYENGDPPLYVNSIAIGPDGYIYTMARMTENGKTRSDLIRIPNPLVKPQGDN